MDSLAAVHAWESGCQSDAVRNDVLIPHLSRCVADARPDTILDIGCGSGYIARAVASSAAASTWLLLDSRLECLAYARSAWPVASEAVTFIRHDLTSGGSAESAPLQDGFSDVAATPVAFAFAAFTLLEFPVTVSVAANLARWLRTGAHLAVYLPDLSRDVRAAAAERPTVRAQYRAGQCELVKTNAWTGERYPFHAVHPSRLVHLMRIVGLRLVSTERLPRVDRREDLLCFGFRRVKPSAWVPR